MIRIYKPEEIEQESFRIIDEELRQTGRKLPEMYAPVITETNMARAGIHAGTLGRLGGEVLCYMGDSDVARLARQRQVTRACISMEKTAEAAQPYIYVIGNAPTALLRVVELAEEGRIRPWFVIGAPVGFVNVTEAKERLIASGIPCIVPRGRKGGSNVAAAIMNALLYEKAGR